MSKKAQAGKNILDQITADKRKWVARQKAKAPLATLMNRMGEAPPVRDFKAALERMAQMEGHRALITEIKRASPSHGLIREDFNPASLAKDYADGGAACLSVLTDTDYFQGKDSDLQAARSACQLPVLRKDFMIDSYQIYESRLLGADCILLILAALTVELAKELLETAQSLGMAVLIECHDEAELDTALGLMPPEPSSVMIGINARNLKTLEVDIANGADLLARIPSRHFAIAESGLKTRADLDRMASAGARGFLIGESLMRIPDIAPATRALVYPSPSGLTHLDAKGQAAMVDVGSKPETERKATAKGRIRMKPETLKLIESGGAKKGDVLAAARLAGIMAAKKTSDLIPLCHPLALTSIKVDFTFSHDPAAVDIAATCALNGRTGVEMEALTAVSVAALTLYDMVKAVDKTMVIEAVHLHQKSGGRSGTYEATEQTLLKRVS